MKTNITFSADAALVQEARRRAAADHTSLNAVFRDWLAAYVAEPAAAQRYREVMGRLGHIRSHGPYTREEMNERR
jgi:hypothetical protein